MHYVILWLFTIILSSLSLLLDLPIPKHLDAMWNVTILGFLVFAIVRVLIDSAYYVKELPTFKSDYFLVLLPGFYGIFLSWLVYDENVKVIYLLAFWVVSIVISLMEFILIVSKPKET